MKRIFEVKKIDTDFYNEKIRDFLPDKIIDIHTHVWLHEHRLPGRVRRISDALLHHPESVPKPVSVSASKPATEPEPVPAPAHEPAPAPEPEPEPALMLSPAPKPESALMPAHAHEPAPMPALRTAAWPDLVASANPAEDLMETYRLLFPGKAVTPLIFSNLSRDDDIGAANEYVRICSDRYKCPSLLFAAPWWSADELERRVKEGHHLGCKVYLNMADPDIKADDIRIFDFLPRHQLEVLDRNRWIAMLHIPGSGRLRGRSNLEQMLEIENRYPGVRLIIAHVGRAYCPEDIGDAFEVLAGTSNMLFDISANTSSYVFERLINAVGPGRILFGSDLPILRMRAARVCEGGNYVNIVPEGLYGDVSGDSHMRGAKGSDAEKITFLLYEEIEAFRKAAMAAGLTRGDIADVFCNNAAGIFRELGYGGF